MGLDFQSVIAGAKNALDSTIRGGKQTLEGVSNWAQSLVRQAGQNFQAAFNGNVVGLKVSGIPAMRTAIDDYCAGVETMLDDVASKVKADIVLKGQTSTALDTFMQAAATQCQNLVSQLRRFEDKLDEVQAAYNKTDTSLSSEIKTASTEASSQYEHYTYGGAKS